MAEKGHSARTSTVRRAQAAASIEHLEFRIFLSRSSTGALVVPTSTSSAQILTASPALQEVASSIAVSARVQANGNVNVRSAPPGLALLSTEASGGRGTITAGPTIASLSGTTYNWYNISWDDGKSGWSADIGLTQLGSPPSISGVSPSSLPASSSNQTLTINGSNFQSGATLTFVPPEGGAIASTASKLTVVSAGQISYQFNNANDAGTWSVKVNNPDGQSSSAISFSVTPVTQPPSISGVSPTSMPASLSNQTLTINGSNFQSGATLTFVPPEGGSIASAAAKLTVVSGGQITYQFNNANDTGTWTVRVNNPDGQSSAAISFLVLAVDQPPAIANVSPSSLPASSSNQTLTINGSNFQSGATLTFVPPEGGAIASTASKLTVVSSTQITYQFNNDGDVGTWSVQITNPDGLSSAVVSFAVTSTATATDDYPATLKSAAQDSLIDPWSFYNRECTSYVAWRMNRDHGALTAPYYFTDFMTGPNGSSGRWGNAAGWADNARAIGFVVDHTPAVGAIAQWTSINHVAYVESVNPDGTVNVSEYNYHDKTAPGTWSFRANLTPEWFIHVNNSASSQPPSISGVSPTSMPASSSNQTLTISGGNFQSGASLTFVPPEGGSIASTASKLTVVSSTQITYQFNNGGDAGTWTVKVNNPDGRSSTAVSFLVTPVSQQGTPGVDYRVSLGSATSGVDLAAIKNAGKSFVGEYLGMTDNAGYLRPGDVTAITTQGLGIVSIFERTPNVTSYFTTANADFDATDAISAAIKAGQPSGSAIYFTVDYDPGSDTTALAAIDSYFRELRSQLNQYFASHAGISYALGAYGPGDVLPTLMNDASIGASYSWSWGQTYAPSNLRQIQDSTPSNPIVLGGVQVDLDQAYTSDYGQWSGTSSTNHPPTPPTNISPANGAPGQPLTPELTATAFSDPDAGDTEAAAEWVVTNNADGSTVIDTVGDTTDLTSYTFPPGPLAGGGAYSWKVRYQDNHGAWSDFSTPTTFTTGVVTARVAVQLSGSSVINGQSAPINFGTVQQNQAGASLTFTVQNTGQSPLTLNGLAVPAGYTVTSGLSTPLAAGASEAFTIRLDATAAGTKAGNVSFTTNDPANPTFQFPVTGIVSTITYTISTSSSPAAGGTTSGGGTFDAGATVTVVATANSGYGFVNWTESGNVVSTSASYGFTATAARSLVANFVVNPATYTLNVSASNGSVLRSPNQATYAAGSQVTLMPVPAAGYQFAGWGGDVSGAAVPLVVTMSSNMNVTATFTQVSPAGPVAIASGLTSPAALVLDGGNAYFGDASDGTLKRVPLNGGAVGTVLSGASLLDSGAYRGVVDFSMDGSTIYGGFGGYSSYNVFSSPKAGGSPSTLFGISQGKYIGEMGGYIYFSSGFSSISKIAVSGGSPTTLTSGGYFVRSTAIDSSAIYFLDYNSKSVMRLDLASGQVTTLIPGNGSEGGVFIDANNVYYSVSGTIRAVPKTGGTVTTLVNTGSATGYASDGQSVYYVDGGNLRSIPVAGGASVNLASVAGQSVTSMAVSGMYVVWTDNSGGTGAGKVYALLRPMVLGTGANTITIRRDGDNVSADVSLNGGTAQKVSLAQGTALAITGNTGSDTLTLDFSNGDPLPAAGINFDGGGGVNAIVVIGTSGSDSLTVAGGSLTFASGTFGNVPISAPNVQSIQFRGGSGGSDVVNMAGGSYSLDADTPTGTPNVSVAVQAGASVTFPSDQHLAGLSINGGSVALGSSSVVNLTLAGPLTITGGGTLDLGRGTLLVPTSADLASYVARAAGAGRPGGVNAWDGSGLTSSVVKADAANNNARALALGYFDSRENATTGLNLPAGDTLVKYTVYGDATGDGVDDTADFTVWRNNAFTGARWSQGDFNYDGAVDTADFTTWRNNFFKTAGSDSPSVTSDVGSVDASGQMPPLPSGPAVATAQGVPEVAATATVPTTAVESAPQPARHPWLVPWRRIARQRRAQALQASEAEPSMARRRHAK